MEYIIIGLLTVIAVSEVSRLVLTHKKTTKTDHFGHKLDATQKMMWDLEFKRFKTEEIREDVRQAYDSMKARIDNLNNQYNTFPEDKDPADRARIKDDIVRAEKERDRYEQQIKGLDIEVYGSKPTADYPNGVQGIVDQIESLRELVTMLKDWIKTL